MDTLTFSKKIPVLTVSSHHHDCYHYILCCFVVHYNGSLQGPFAAYAKVGTTRYQYIIKAVMMYKNELISSTDRMWYNYNF